MFKFTRISTICACFFLGHLFTSITLKAAHLIQDVDLQINSIETANLLVDTQTLEVAGHVKVSILNAGIESLEDSVEVLLFEDRNLNSLFDPSKDNVLGSAFLPDGMAALAETTITVSLSGHLQFAGNRIFAKVDPQNRISETDESNNLTHTAVVCGFPPGTKPLSPVLQMTWTGAGAASSFNQVIATPMVIHLNDDNGDGEIARNDIPEIVFAATNNVGSAAGISPGILRAINGKTGEIFFEVTDNAFRVQAGGQIAAGDIDGDGLPEIIAPAADARHLLTFEHDGSFKWQSPEIGIDLGGASIADLNQDGLPEVIIGATVLDANGALIAQGQSSTGRNGGTGPLSNVADLDMDGSLEIIAGNTAYRADGSQLWQNNTVGDGFTAIANLDDDPFPEIILISIGFLSVLEHDGSLKWGPQLIPGGGEGGAPTVADVDGDGQPEIGIAGALRYSIFETDGTLKWTQPINDISSGLASSTIFDFENDGRSEVIYGDQDCLKFFDGATGRLLVQIRNPSGTLLENPVVADVDGDGQAELLAVRNQILQRDPNAPRDQGIFVFGDSLKNWTATRQVWNQYGYHITNITTDGRIPQPEAVSWLTHNTYRANLPLKAQSLVPQPDLAPSLLVQDSANKLLKVRIGNGGNAPVPAGVSIAFFMADSKTGTRLIDVAMTSLELNPGAFEDVTISFLNTTDDSIEIVVIADDDGTGQGTVNECDEMNNRYSLKLPPAPKLIVRFESPADASSVCEPQVEAIARVDLTSSVTLDSCTIAGVRVEPDSAGRIRRLVPLAPGPNSIVATCFANGGLLMARDSLLVTFDQPPIANAGGPYIQVVDSLVQFDGTLSRDPENAPLTFTWDFGDGTQATGARPTHVYAAPDTYSVVLSVTDSSSCFASDTTIAIIRDKEAAQIAVQILSPVDSSETFCGDSILVLARVSAPGNGSLPALSRCEINGIQAQVNADTFTALVSLAEGENSIIARCITADNFVSSDTLVIFNNREFEPPTCKLELGSGVRIITAFDDGSGIASFAATLLENTRLVIPDFEPGAKEVTIRAEAIDPNASMAFDIKITDRCGNFFICDPIFLDISPDQNRLNYTVPFAAIERYLTIENHGLTSIAFDINGFSFTVGDVSFSDGPNFPLLPYGSVTFDLLGHLKSSGNIFRISIPDEPSNSASIRLMNFAETVDHVLGQQYIPQQFTLWQNYPNPFNPETRVVFDLPQSQSSQTYPVRLDIYNIRGETVRTLVDKPLSPGRHEILWNGRNRRGQTVPSGVYFYRLRVGERLFMRRMVVVR